MVSLIPDLGTIANIPNLIGGIAAIAFVTVAGLYVLYTTIEQKYPKIEVRYVDGRNMMTKGFRLVGQAIVEDNIMAIMMNKFIFCGNAAKLDYVYINGMKKVYLASFRRGYLAQINSIMDTAPIQIFPIENEQGKIIGNATLNKKGLLMPLNIDYKNDKLSEKEIANGKYIAADLIEQMSAAKAYADNNNPIMAQLIASIPMLLMIGLIGLVLYLTMGQIATQLTETAKIAKDLVIASQGMR